MLTFLIILHVVICIAMIFIVLIQTSKGGLDSTFGGVATNMLGTQGANDFVKNWTKILFAAFVVSCILLAFQVKRTGGGGAIERSLLSDDAQTETTVPFDFGTENTDAVQPPAPGEQRMIQIGGDSEEGLPGNVRVIQIGGDPDEE